mmetsp:Transcript_19316/g.28848  ORF Transcript_19316/g.28848 Transcript_19316/m.28848 type:complete len:498 (+) Transcript_19316:44-1537(+)|eukprot:CAMPEP_0167757952 /NCGR_PEP_ID=MMETSP0110_2-20121227/10204_1 /TAXON_ID=629695 /ORGANISM="Gymnochlora sp., Strain CCMP2014" /LENGTH=497 /DNA_ID=CAMNT_0007644185 /DNA_START=15 /DNA_END=1508 /DNA_ORIENTATION=+
MADSNKAKPEEKKVKDEEKKEVKEATAPKPKTPFEEFEAAIILIAKGVRVAQNGPITRAVRKSHMLRKKLSKADLIAVVEKYFSAKDNKGQLLDCVKLIQSPTMMEVEGTDSAVEKMEIEEKTSEKDFELLPEVKVYVYLIILIALFDKKMIKEAIKISEVAMKIVKSHNKRTMDPISARIYFYYGLSYTALGSPVTIRNQLLALYRSACLHHDVPGQAVLQNAILANYLYYNMYGQAEMFCNVTNAIEKDNNQYSRFLYYTGKINAVRLHYSDAEECLSQALRKCPKSALGFRQIVTKLLCIVQLLMGDIPERSVFLEKELERSLFPYFKLTQAVRVGSLLEFQKVLENFEGIFKKDGMISLITRLRHNVIKTGLRKICISYSKISLTAICEKLKYDSIEDIEYIVAKAIHDGVINACIDRKGGYVMSKENLDLYSSDEPAKAFDKRINFCLKLHNEAVKAMAYPIDAHKPKREKKMIEAEKEESEKKESKTEKKK